MANATKLDNRDLNELIMNFFVIEGYKDAAAVFQKEASVEPDMDLESITGRMEVRTSVQNGDIPAAIEKVQQLDAEILNENTELVFHLKQQQLIELIRKGDVDAALDFAQRELSSLGQENPHFLGELERTMALLAFDVTNTTSPVASLLETRQRLKVASEVNAALLVNQGQEKEAKLVDLLRMVKWAQDKVAGQGAIFPRLTNLADASFPSSSSSSSSSATSSSLSSSAGASSSSISSSGSLLFKSSS